MTAKEVKAARARLGLTQKAFAEALGSSIRTVQKWEQGERTVRAARIGRTFVTC